MTGFGRAGADAGPARLSAEARSVNQKGLHVLVSLPEQLAALEQDIRDEVRRRFSRGRIELRLTIGIQAGASPPPPVDVARAAEFARAAELLAGEFGIPAGITGADLLRMPGVARPVWEVDPPGGPAVMECVRACLDSLAESRRAEGAALAALLAARLGRMRDLASRVAGIQQDSVPAAFDRMRERVRRLLDGAVVDEQRMLQELAILADRLDVGEELERLECHISSSLALASSDEPDAGRRLGFLLQELQREINTLGSKLETPEGTMIVVEMKNELSTLREQIANVE